MSEYAEAYFDECMALKRELKEQRAKTIEECARVAEKYLEPDHILIAAIRALKDKP